MDPVGLSAPEERGNVQKTWKQENENLHDQLKQVFDKVSALVHQQASGVDQDGTINVIRSELDQEM